MTAPCSNLELRGALIQALKTISQVQADFLFPFRCCICYSRSSTLHKHQQQQHRNEEHGKVNSRKMRRSGTIYVIFFPTGISATKPLRISSKYTFLWCFLAFAEPNLGPAVGNFKLPALISAMLLYPDRSHQDESVPAFS